jgi:hypothetical protein
VGGQQEHLVAVERVELAGVDDLGPLDEVRRRGVLGELPDPLRALEVLNDSSVRHAWGRQRH